MPQRFASQHLKMYLLHGTAGSSCALLNLVTYKDSGQIQGAQNVMGLQIEI